MNVHIANLIFTALVFASLLVGLICQPAYAFKCKEPGTPRQELEKAAAVFIGTATKINEESSYKIIEFKVEKSWKGPTTKSITVRTGKHLYGYRFTTGKKYLVYAYGEGELETSRCGRTKSKESATMDLKELGEGKAPE